jgi:hypothetical protein
VFSYDHVRVIDKEAGGRLRRLIEETNGFRYGWITAVANASGLGRPTIQRWLAGQEPKLSALALLAPHVHLTRAELVAAYDGTPLTPDLPARVREGMRLFLEAAQAEGLVATPPSRSAPRAARQRRASREKA